MFRRVLVAIPIILFTLSVTSSTKAQTFNLAADWSDIVNPNGTWSYGLLSSGNFTPFALHTNTYVNVGAPAFTGNQPAWTRTVNTGNNGTPEGMAKSIGISNIDFPSERVGGHTPASSNYLAVRWTAPAAGTVDITGGVWMWRDLGRVEGVSLFVKGNSLFNDVAIPSRTTGITSSNTFTLADAIIAGGGSASSLSNVSVNQGTQSSLRRVA